MRVPRRRWPARRPRVRRPPGTAHWPRTRPRRPARPACPGRAAPSRSVRRRWSTGCGTSLHRVAHGEAVPAVEEGEAVVEGPRVGVAEGLGPGRPAVVGAVDPGRLALADGEHHGPAGVERLHVPELQLAGARRRDVPPGGAAVGGGEDGAPGARHPGGVAADGGEAPEADVGRPGGAGVLQVPVRALVRLRGGGRQRGERRRAHRSRDRRPARAPTAGRAGGAVRRADRTSSVPRAPHGGRS